MTKQMTAMAALVAVIMFGVVSSASGIILFADDFDYPLGSLAGNGLWDDVGSGTTAVTDNNLSYPGYAGSSGNSAGMPAGTNSPAFLPYSLPFAQTIINSAGDYYLSLLYGNASHQDTWVPHAEYFIKRAAHEGQPNTRVGNADDPGWPDTGVPLASGPNGVDLVVVKYTSDGGGGGGNDGISAIVNPDLSQPLATLQAQIDGAQVQQTRDLGANQGNPGILAFTRAPGHPESIIDGVHYATTLGEALFLPEPASMTLLAMGGLAMLRRRR